jgi:hypothetical protein
LQKSVQAVASHRLRHLRHKRDPDEIRAWLRWYHSLEPIVMTPEEEAAWEADRKTQKEFDIANAAERDRRIEGMFE